MLLFWQFQPLFTLFHFQCKFTFILKTVARLFFKLSFFVSHKVKGVWNVIYVTKFWVNFYSTLNPSHSQKWLYRNCLWFWNIRASLIWVVQSRPLAAFITGEIHILIQWLLIRFHPLQHEHTSLFWSLGSRSQLFWLTGLFAPLASSVCVPHIIQMSGVRHS